MLAKKIKSVISSPALKFNAEKAEKIKDYILSHKKTSALLAGGITLFAYAPFSIWAFMILGFVTLNVLLNNTESAKSRLFIVFLFSLAFNVVNLHWVGKSFLYNAPQPYLVYFMPILIFIMGLLLTIPYVVTFFALDKIKVNPLCKSIFLVPIVFVISEYLRSLTVFGFPWDLIGYSVASNDYLLQLSEYGSVIFLSFLILIISSLIAKLEQKYFVIAFMILIWWIVMGGARQEYVSLKHKENKALETVKIVQQDKPAHHLFNKDKMRKQVLFYLENLRSLNPQNNKEDIIVFPEMAIPYPIEKTPNLMNIFQESLDEKDTLILGGPAFDKDEIYNSLYYITKDSYVRYDKKLLVPFGEFLPFRSLLDKVKNFTNNYKDFSIGEKANITEINNVKYLSLICYEVIFPSFVKEKIADNENVVLMNLTNDAWFYGTVAPYQHALIAKTRAVENGVPLVRAANTGISYIID